MSLLTLLPDLFRRCLLPFLWPIDLITVRQVSRAFREQGNPARLFREVFLSYFPTREVGEKLIAFLHREEIVLAGGYALKLFTGLPFEPQDIDLFFPAIGRFRENQPINERFALDFEGEYEYVNYRSGREYFWQDQLQTLRRCQKDLPSHEYPDQARWDNRGYPLMVYTYRPIEPPNKIIQSETSVMMDFTLFSEEIPTIQLVGHSEEKGVDHVFRDFDLDVVKIVWDGSNLTIGPQTVTSILNREGIYHVPQGLINFQRLIKYQQRGFQITVVFEKIVPLRPVTYLISGRFSRNEITESLRFLPANLLNLVLSYHDDLGMSRYLEDLITFLELPYARHFFTNWFDSVMHDHISHRKRTGKWEEEYPSPISREEKVGHVSDLLYRWFLFHLRRSRDFVGPPHNYTMWSREEWAVRQSLTEVNLPHLYGLVPHFLGVESERKRKGDPITFDYSPLTSNQFHGIIWRMICEVPDSRYTQEFFQFQALFSLVYYFGIQGLSIR